MKLKQNVSSLNKKKDNFTDYQFRVLGNEMYCIAKSQNI